jgi:hypothetical protein
MTIEEMLTPYESDTQNYLFVNSGLVKLRIEPKLYSEIVSGCYAAALRFLRCAEASSTFSKSIIDKGDAPPFPERAIQDQSLFDFFINGLSSIESFSYSLHGLAVALDTTGTLSMDEKRIRFITPITVQKMYSKLYPEEPITKKVKGVIGSMTFLEWKRIRNIIIHRNMPPRRIYMFLGSVESKPSELSIGLSLDSNTTVSRLSWLRESLNEMLSALAVFIETRIELRENS